MKAWVIAGLVVLVLHARTVQPKSISDTAGGDDELEDDIKRLLSILENEEELTDHGPDNVDEEGQTEADRDAAAIRELEAYLASIGQPAPEVIRDDSSKASMHHRIEELVELARDNENTIFLEGNEIKRPGHTVMSEYIGTNEWKGGDDIREVEETNTKRQAVTSRLWPNGVIPWCFDPALTDVNIQNTIRKAAEKWEEMTCVKFPDKTSNDTRYLKIGQHGGCWSYVGASVSSGPQQLSIGSGCEYHGVVIHELGHALGLVHEQSRSDRDQHVVIHFDNIKAGYAGNFRKSTTAQLMGPYDLNSIMHYGRTYFNSMGTDTITAKNADEQALIGNRQGLTPIDVMHVNNAYGCTDHCQNQVTTADCQNYGFLKKDCTCWCPLGLGGLDCSVTDPTWSQCGGIIELDVNNPSVDIESPNYPNAYTAGDKCAWVFKIPTSLSGYVIQLKVIAIDTYASGQSCKDTVEVRKNWAHQKGIRMCGQKALGSTKSPVHTLETKPDGAAQMSVLFQSDASVAPQTGFKAVASIRAMTACYSAPCSDLERCEDNGSTTTHTCVCLDGLQGQNCDEVRDQVINEDFEGNKFKFTGWTENVGGTPSINTGPSGDHTTGSGTYMFYETSSPVSVGDTLKLESFVKFSSDTERCLDFAYHMFGVTMGSLEVKLSVDGVEQSSSLFKKEGNQWYNWHNGTLIIPKQSGNWYKILFIGIRGTSWRSDIAVDDIEVRPCSSPPITTVVPPPMTTFVPRPKTTFVPPPMTTFVPPPMTTFVPRPMTTFVPRPKTTFVPRPMTTFVPRPKTTFVPQPMTTDIPPPVKPDLYNIKPIEVYTRPVMCDFEEDLHDCFISNARDYRTDFVKSDSCDDRFSPCNDHTSGEGYYLTFRAKKTVHDDGGRLIGPWLLFENTKACFGGFFQRTGAVSARVVVKELNYQHKEVEYYITNIGANWEEWNITIPISAPFRVELVVNGDTRGDDIASLSVDDLYVRRGDCSRTPPPNPPTTPNPPPTANPPPTTGPIVDPCTEYVISHGRQWFGAARKTGVSTVDGCKMACDAKPCKVGGCVGFDYNHERNQCWIFSDIDPAATQLQTYVDHYRRKIPTTSTNTGGVTDPAVIFMSDFDGNGGNFHDEVGFYDWKKWSGETVSVGTGPDGDHTTGTGNYMYTDGRNQDNEDVFKMESDVIQTWDRKVCLTFWLNAHGPDLGEFRAQIVDADNYKVYREFVLSPHSSDDSAWIQKSVTAKVKKANVRIIFEVVRKGVAGDYAIDDVKLRKKACKYYV